MRGVWIPLIVLAACGDDLTPNRAPEAVAFELTTTEDLSVTRSIDATDIDGDALEVRFPAPPKHGTATANGFSITYTPKPNFHGLDQFPVVVTDGFDEAAVTIKVRVNSVNDVPFGFTDSLAINEDTPRTFPISLLVDNDTDNDGEPLTVTSVGEAVHGSVFINGINVTFTPALNFNGEASFIYHLTDGIADVPVTVNVVISPVNDAPVAGDDGATTTVITPVVLSTATLIANDTDPENDTLTISSVNTPVGGTATLDGSGNVTYTPAVGFVGNGSFQYVVTDGIATDVGLVTVAVTL